MKKEKLIESLKKVKQSVCCYNQRYQGFCDCKYITDQTSEQIKSPSTENTGCCEISIAIHVLSNMNDKNYEILTKESQSTNFKAKSREEHIAEFWQSFYNAIQRASGNISSFHPHMTLIEIAEVLAQNNIRFVYKKEL
jgi:hypothetical protein